MNSISLTFSILRILFICIFSNVSSLSNRRDGRLLGAELITGDQLNTNYKGSGSMAIVYKDSYYSDAVAIVAPDKLLTVGSILSIEDYTKVRVSALVKGTLDNHGSIDGEEYAISGTASVSNTDFSVFKFGPLLATSKAFVATLPSATSHPPKLGNKDCIAYAYAPNKEGDTAPSHIQLGYLPLTIIENPVCSALLLSAYDDTTKYFCATATSPTGSNPDCVSKYALDGDLMAYCPATSLAKKDENPEKADLKEGEKKWCFISGNWWWWWCNGHNDDNEGPAPETEWILTGVVVDRHSGSGCNTPDDKITIAFAYTGNLNLS